MAGDFNKPVNADSYTDVLAAVRDLCADLAKMLDATSTANVPSGAIRWNGTNNRFEKYNGTSWSVLTAKMLMNIDQLDGCDAGNASGNIPVSNGTRCVDLNADKLDGYEAAALLKVASNLVDLADAATARTNLGLGSAAQVDTGTSSGEVPLNSSLGTAAYVDTGEDADQVPLNSSLGEAATADLADQATAEAGTDNTDVMTPLRVSQLITALLASEAQAEAGTDNTKLMTPLRVAQAIAALGGDYELVAAIDLDGDTEAAWTGLDDGRYKLVVDLYATAYSTYAPYIQFHSGSAWITSGYSWRAVNLYDSSLNFYGSADAGISLCAHEQSTYPMVVNTNQQIYGDFDVYLTGPRIVGSLVHKTIGHHVMGKYGNKTNTATGIRLLLGTNFCSGTSAMYGTVKLLKYVGD